MQRPLCNDCSLDLLNGGEYCMLHLAVWLEANDAAPVNNLCIGCIERRLRRNLRPEDFDNTYQQNWKPGKSARMRDRMGIDEETARRTHSERYGSNSVRR